ncbi:MAG TPA: hypothetical protein VGG39_30185 [Polyangiaceae bacterium]|jgi:hypothetical protein
MRFQHLAGVVLCAAFIEMGFLACKSGSTQNNQGADDAGDEGDGGGDGYDAGLPPLGDDSSSGDELFTQFDAFTGGEAGAPCTIASGTYTETITWQPDAGAGDSGAACQSSTTSFTWPKPLLGPADGSPYGCIYTADGTLPICDFYFSCLSDDGTYTIRTTGNIDVFNGSYGGHQSEEVLLDGADGGALFTCEYQLEFTPQ